VTSEASHGFGIAGEDRTRIWLALHRGLPCDADVSDPSPVVAVVGLGYVGLPLALHFADANAQVVGVDIDPAKVRRLNAGESYISHLPSERIADAVRRGRLVATTDFERLRHVDAVLICVPTPLTRQQEPDLSFVLATGAEVGRRLRPGQLVVLESTTYPGTTDGVLRDVLEAESGWVAGKDFHLAYSPEREDPGNPRSSISAIPKVVGGLTPACRDAAAALYQRVVQRVVVVSSCRAAEATKLLENIFRSVNIALVNEIKLVYEAMGIDVWEVIEAASTKPFGFMPFYPGPGLGGHCIPVDPFYLAWTAKEFGLRTRFVELAGEINTSMPVHVVHKVADALNEVGKPLKGARVLVLGIAYKPGIDDDRESPSYALMQGLASRGAIISYHDPHIPTLKPTREHPQWAGASSVPFTEETVSQQDVVLIATAHRAVDYDRLAEWATLVVDTRNMMRGARREGGKARIVRA